MIVWAVLQPALELLGPATQAADARDGSTRATTGTRSRWDELAESRLTGPYLQVARMHLVIIAFGAAHAARLESFAVFAAIYALYFFPRRLVRERVSVRSLARQAASTG